MEKMKSALEIALEKAKKMGGPAKTEGVDSQRYVQAALSLGNSFLQGKTGAEKIKESLDRYPEESREAARGAFLTAITKGMNLINTPEILAAVLLLKEDDRTQAACAKLKEFQQQQLQQLKEKKAALQASSFEHLLEKMGIPSINGSALAGFNTQHLPGWEKTKTELISDYEKQIQNFCNVILK